MTLFVVLAVALIAVCLAFLLPPLLRKRVHADVDRASANLGILKDQLADLEAEHARGSIDDDHYAEAKGELERRVLDEVQSQPAQAATPARGGRAAAIAVALAVPVVAGLVYAHFGDLGAFNPLLAKAPTEEGHSTSPEKIDAMIDSLRQRLEKEPENAGGWSTLAHSYYVRGRFVEASAAYEKLVALVPDDADTLADYADSLAMAQGRRFEGKPRTLIKRALELEPSQWKALAMAGTDQFDQGNYKQAAAYWERLMVTLPEDSPIRQQVAGSVAEARSKAGLPAAPPMAQAAPQTKPSSPVAAAKPGAGAKVTGVVTLTPELAAKARPEDPVFIFARAAEGSRMPLALTQVQVKDLPARFALDDTMAMSPDFRLSSQDKVIVGARVSKSGRPMPASGDLEGLSTPVKVGASDVKITINNVLP